MKPNLLCAALCLFAAGAAAQDLPERERQILRALDFDGDAAVSRDEARWGQELIRSLAGESAGAGGTAARRTIPGMFRRLDRNQDGRLSGQELFSEEAPRGGGWMALDRDGDGFIAPAEFAAMRPD
jgi:hypothetical protein